MNEVTGSEVSLLVCMWKQTPDKPAPPEVTAVATCLAGLSLPSTLSEGVWETPVLSRFGGGSL